MIKMIFIDIHKNFEKKFIKIILSEIVITVRLNDRNFNFPFMGIFPPSQINFHFSMSYKILMVKKYRENVNDILMECLIEKNKC